MSGPMDAEVDWRFRDQVWFADFLDGDRHLIVGTHKSNEVADRSLVNIPHPLPGVRYADGVLTPQDLTELLKKS